MRPPSRPKPTRPATPKPPRNWQPIGGLPSARGLTVLGNCESGSNYRKNTGNGYYGKYQVSPRTWRGWWRAWGYPQIATMRPDLAAPAVQDDTVRRAMRSTSDKRAYALQQWPGCTRKHGAWWSL